MQVLIVDDEPKVLEGLERSLFHLDWDIITAESGSEALELLQDNAVDVVISDMRMPEMDGAELLERVKEAHPQALRVVLSGHTEIEAAMRTVPVAHQFLSKPCSADVVQEVIERALSLAAYLKREDLKSLVGQISQLPSVPRTYMELTDVIRKPNSSVQDVAAVVERDVAMSAKVLQLVNSSFFSQARVTASVQQAVVRLGVDMMKSLALATHAFSCDGAAEPGMRAFLEREQHHALLVAAVAKALCNDRKTANQAFFAAVLHDIGKVVLRLGAPDLAQEVRELHEQGDISVYDAEEALFGVTHAEVGAYLIGMWGLPFPIVEAVAHHHRPERIGYANGMSVVAALHLANGLVGDLELSEVYLEQAGLMGQMDVLRERAAAVVGM